MTWEKHRQTAGLIFFVGITLIFAAIGAAFYFSMTTWLLSVVVAGGVSCIYGCLIEFISTEVDVRR